MLVYTREKLIRLLKIDFVRFALVGGCGFIVSEAFLFALNGQLGLVRWLSLVIGNEAGLLTTFVLHQSWTYKHIDHSHKPILYKLRRFHLSSWSGVLIIISISLFCVHILNLNVYIGQAIGSSVSGVWNFLWTKYFIFKGKTPETLMHIEEVVE